MKKVIGHCGHLYRNPLSLPRNIVILNEIGWSEVQLNVMLWVWGWCFHYDSLFWFFCVSFTVEKCREIIISINNQSTRKSLFCSITILLTVFPKKLTKYSGIWEMDILKFSGHHMSKPNKPGKRERKKKFGSASHVHKTFGMSRTATSGFQDRLWQCLQHPRPPPPNAHTQARIHTNMHTHVHFHFVPYAQCRWVSSTYWKASCMCPPRLWSLHSRLFLCGDERHWSEWRVTTPHDTTVWTYTLPRAVITPCTLPLAPNENKQVSHPGKSCTVTPTRPDIHRVECKALKCGFSLSTLSTQSAHTLMWWIFICLSVWPITEQDSCVREERRKEMTPQSLLRSVEFSNLCLETIWVTSSFIFFFWFLP